MSEYLALYMARIVAYRVEDTDYGVRVTMRVDFPVDAREGNVNLWTYFIAQAAHKIGKKPRIEVIKSADNMIGYCTFMIWKEPKFIESKATERTRF